VTTGFVQGMACGECGARYPVAAIHVCEACFGPLEIAYDWEGIRRAVSRPVIEARPRTMWRYAELLPLDGPPAVGLDTGMTPLVRADRLARRLGVGEVWIKNDAVSHPTLSFKDRVVAVALSRARELGISVVGCASTGNLANATAALAAAMGLRAVVVLPAGLEQAKILGTSVYGADVIAVEGTYDDVNRLCSEIADRHGWGFVNVNLRPFYGEGSKSYAFEIAEQLGWRLPADVVVPMAGGSLLAKVGKAFAELRELGLVEGGPARLHGAQPAACAPIASMVIEGRDAVVPIKHPRTIATSLAIGDPADAFAARQAILGSGGFAAMPSEEEIVAGVRLLAVTEGIFGETAAGVTVAAAAKLVAEGRIGRGDGPLVLCVTGQGLKTQQVLAEVLPAPARIGPSLAAFERLLDAGGPLDGLAASPPAAKNV
jgi:threonine synthase